MNEEDLRKVKHASEVHGLPIAEVAAEVLDGETLEEKKEAKAKRRGHWPAYITAMVVVGALVGLVIVGVLKFVNDPVEAGVSTLKGARPADPAATPGVSQLVGRYVSMSYPGAFDQVGQTQGNAAILEQYRLGSKTNHRRTVTVSVWPLPAGGLQDDASYRVRMLDLAGNYDETAEKLAGEQVTFMTKADKSEQTLFWPHKDKLLIVAVTSSDARDDVPVFMKVIKDSARWAQ